MESKLKQSAMYAVGELPAGYLHLPEKFEPEPELTEWIDGDFKPMRDGVYERDYARHYKKPILGYALFLKGKWHGGVRKSNFWAIENASKVRKVSTIQNLPWRGLSKDPNQS